MRYRGRKRMTVCLWGRAVIWHVLIILLLPVECNIRVKNGQTNLIAWCYAGGGIQLLFLHWKRSGSEICIEHMNRLCIVILNRQCFVPCVPHIHTHYIILHRIYALDFIYMLKKFLNVYIYIYIYIWNNKCLRLYINIYIVFEMYYTQVCVYVCDLEKYVNLTLIYMIFKMLNYVI